MKDKIVAIVFETLGNEADPKEQRKLYNAIESLVKEEMKVVDDFRTFQRGVILKMRKNVWASTKDKEATILKVREEEEKLDTFLATYFPKPVNTTPKQGTLL